MKVAVVSLGCAKNLVDSEVMLGILSDSSFQVVEEAADAEVIVVNTCGFITAAKEESVNTILEMAALKERGRCRALIVAGCLAQKYKDELLSDIPELDAVIGTGEVDKIAEIVHRALTGEKVDQVDIPKFIYDHSLPRRRSTPGYSAYVKVAEGCDNRCSYCVIPEMRGAFRSRPQESILAEVKNLAQAGVREIMLIAQDTTSYGRDLYGEYKLPELLRQLSRVDGVEWIRLLYCYPTHFSQELIDVMAEEAKICKYVDLPLQHGDDRILKAMGRRGSVSQVEDLIRRLRLAMPEMALRTTFIVGFPGETEENFSELLNFIERIGFDRVGAFTYSQEEGTPAGERLDQIPEEIKQERLHRLMTLQSEISLRLNSRWVGKEVKVLVEGKTGNPEKPFVARTERDAPEVDGQVYFSGKAVEAGQFVNVRIIDADTYDLIGEMAP